MNADWWIGAGFLGAVVILAAWTIIDRPRHEAVPPQPVRERWGRVAVFLGATALVALVAGSLLGYRERQELRRELDQVRQLAVEEARHILGSADDFRDLRRRADQAEAALLRMQNALDAAAADGADGKRQFAELREAIESLGAELRELQSEVEWMPRCDPLASPTDPDSCL